MEIRQLLVTQARHVHLARSLYQDADIYLLDVPSLLLIHTKVIEEGHIIQAGKYDELLQSGTDFDALVSAHHEAREAMDTPNQNTIIQCMRLDQLQILNRLKRKKVKRSREKQLVQEEQR